MKEISEYGSDYDYDDDDDDYDPDDSGNDTENDSTGESDNDYSDDNSGEWNLGEDDDELEGVSWDPSEDNDKFDPEEWDPGDSSLDDDLDFEFLDDDDDRTNENELDDNSPDENNEDEDSSEYDADDLNLDAPDEEGEENPESNGEDKNESSESDEESGKDDKDEEEKDDEKEKEKTDEEREKEKRDEKRDELRSRDEDIKIENKLDWNYNHNPDYDPDNPTPLEGEDASMEPPTNEDYEQHKDEVQGEIDDRTEDKLKSEYKDMEKDNDHADWYDKQKLEEWAEKETKDIWEDKGMTDDDLEADMIQEDFEDMMRDYDEASDAPNNNDLDDINNKDPNDTTTDGNLEDFSEDNKGNDKEGELGDRENTSQDKGDFKGDENQNQDQQQGQAQEQRGNSGNTQETVTVDRDEEQPEQLENAEKPEEYDANNLDLENQSSKDQEQEQEQEQQPAPQQDSFQESQSDTQQGNTDEYSQEQTQESSIESQQQSYQEQQQFQEQRQSSSSKQTTVLLQEKEEISETKEKSKLKETKLSEKELYKKYHQETGRNPIYGGKKTKGLIAWMEARKQDSEQEGVEAQENYIKEDGINELEDWIEKAELSDTEKEELIQQVRKYNRLKQSQLRLDLLEEKQKEEEISEEEQREISALKEEFKSLSAFQKETFKDFKRFLDKYERSKLWGQNVVKWGQILFIKDMVSKFRLLKEVKLSQEEIKEYIKEHLYKSTELSMKEKQNIINIIQKENLANEEKEELKSALVNLTMETGKTLESEKIFSQKKEKFNYDYVKRLVEDLGKDIANKKGILLTPKNQQEFESIREQLHVKPYHVPLTVECGKCGHIWNTKGKYIGGRNWCIYCSGYIKSELNQDLEKESETPVDLSQEEFKRFSENYATIIGRIWLKICFQYAMDKKLFTGLDISNLMEKWLRWMDDEPFGRRTDGLYFNIISRDLGLGDKTLRIFLSKFRGDDLSGVSEEASYERFFYHIFKYYQRPSSQWNRMEGYFRELYSAAEEKFSSFKSRDVPTEGTLPRRLAFQLLFQMYEDLSVDTFSGIDEKMTQAGVVIKQVANDFIRTVYEKKITTSSRSGYFINWINYLRKAYEYHGKEFDALQLIADRLINVISMPRRQQKSDRQKMLETIRGEIESYFETIGLELHYVSDYLLNLLFLGARSSLWSGHKRSNLFIEYFKGGTRKKQSLTMSGILKMTLSISRWTSTSFLSVSELTSEQELKISQSLDQFKTDLIGAIAEEFIELKYGHNEEGIQDIIRDKIYLFQAFIPILIRVIEDQGFVTSSLGDISIPMIEKYLQLPKRSLRISNDVFFSNDVLAAFQRIAAEYMLMFNPLAPKILNNFYLRYNEYQENTKDPIKIALGTMLLMGLYAHHSAFKLLGRKLFTQLFRWIEGNQFNAEKKLPAIGSMEHSGQSDLFFFLSESRGARQLFKNILDAQKDNPVLDTETIDVLKFVLQYQQVNIDYHAVNAYAELFRKYGSNQEIEKNAPVLMLESLRGAMQKLWKPGYQLNTPNYPLQRALIFAIYGDYSSEILQGLDEFLRSISLPHEQNFKVISVEQLSDMFGFGPLLKSLIKEICTLYIAATDSAHDNHDISKDKLKNFMHEYKSKINAAIREQHKLYQQLPLPPRVLPRKITDNFK